MLVAEYLALDLQNRKSEGSVNRRFQQGLISPCSVQMKVPQCGHIPWKQELTHTLRIGCTELKAVPHAGLGYQFLRVQVRKPEKEVEVHQVQRGHQL